MHRSVPTCLRLALAGCRLFTAPALALARDYGGLAEILEIPCETEGDRPEAHFDEPESRLTPGVVEGLRRAGPDVVVVAPGHQGHEEGLPPECLVPLLLDPVCLLAPPSAAPHAPVAVLLRPGLVSPSLLAALLEGADRYWHLPALNADHAWAQLAVARRAKVSLVLTEPAAVPLATEAGLPARSYLDPPSHCVVIHAIERALLWAAAHRLSRQAHYGVANAVAAPLVTQTLTAPPLAPRLRDVLALRTGRRFVIVPQTAILYVSSLGGVTTAYTENGRFWTGEALAAVERRLDPGRFLRLDASHLVNLTRITELVPWTHQRYRLVFTDAAKTELVLSRDVGRRLRAALGW